MKGIKRLAAWSSWLLGVLLMLGGIGLLPETLVGGILWMAAGLLMLPPVWRRLPSFKRKGIALPVCCVALIFAGAMLMPDSEPTANLEKQDGPSQSSDGNEEAAAVSPQDILPILFHQPYLDAAGIKVKHESDRKKMPDKIADALRETPVMVDKQDGGLFGADYYAMTSKTAFYYYGKTKDNRPDGFGVLAKRAVSLDDLDSLGSLIYAGNFKKGVYSGYGALFYADADNNASTPVVSAIQEGQIAPEYRDAGAAYVISYVSYDGDWEKGEPNGEGNFFRMDHLKTVVQDNYWGGPIYPTITVTEVKNGLANGKTKYYAYSTLIYDGNTRDGLEHGNGIKYFTNGQKQYDGAWKNGKYDGTGKLYDADGTLIYSGKWKNGDYAS